ncbi:MAG: SDR family oxidoreductase [Bacteroidota bacterium]
MKVKRISILGCGWLGLAVGKALAQEDFTVKGSTTSKEKLALLEAEGIQAFQIKVNDRLEGEDLDAFFDSEVLLLNIPPGRRSPDVEERYPRQVQLVLDAAKGTIKHIIFISSTSVYPNTNGVVTEDTPLAPVTASGKALVAAEGLVWEAYAKQASVLRMAGLAGGEREPGRFFAGKTDLANGAVPVNFVHQDDCVGVIRAVLAQACWGETFNICADLHPLKNDFYPARAKLKGFVVPTYSSATATPSFKVVGNSKVKRVLGYTFIYGDPKKFP